MTNTNADFDQPLDFDPLAAAERLTGSSYKESPGTASLGINGSGTSSKVCLRPTTTTFEGYLSMLDSLGFKELLSGAIAGTEDRWVIYWRDGVLIFSDSYRSGKNLNAGNAYFNYRPNSSESSYFQEFSGCQVLDNTGEVWVGSIDVRQGLRHRLTTMEQNGQLLSVWVEQPFLWLLHYQDTKTPGYSYQDINNSRVSQLPVGIQKAIQGKLA